MRALILVLLAVGLEACGGCTPQLPSNSDNNDNDDDPDDDPDQPGVDSGDDGGPPPPCSVPEEEPNNSIGQAQDLPLGEWACGFMDTSGDTEVFTSDVVEDGWLRVWVRAADIGSTSDVALVVQSQMLDEYGEVLELRASSERIPGSTDALVIVPVKADTTWTFQIVDEVPSFSPTHEWELTANMTKDPTDCSAFEIEDFGANTNNAITTPELVSPGDRICGTIDSSTDQDFFVLDLPEGKSSIRAQVIAWNAGSPVDTDLALYTPEGDLEVFKSVGEYGSDIDPILRHTTSEGGPWSLRVRPQAGGGRLHWYMLDLQVETTPFEDTGATR